MDEVFERSEKSLHKLRVLIFCGKVFVLLLTTGLGRTVVKRKSVNLTSLKEVHLKTTWQ